MTLPFDSRDQRLSHRCGGSGSRSPPWRAESRSPLSKRRGRRWTLHPSEGEASRRENAPMVKAPGEIESDPLSAGWARLADGDWGAARASFEDALSGEQAPEASAAMTTA